MPTCELCGKETYTLTAIVEGTQLNVCKDCAKMGKVVQKPITAKPARPETPREEIIETLVSDYSKRIREAREKSGMTQKDFATKLNEKESLIQKIETGQFKPTIEKAKKFQRILGIKLVEEQAELSSEIKKGKSSTLTIGDIIKIR